ncbi:MAG: hypothetical protein Q8Q09_25815 [Deltaproteobacteria bacterium]|nr:hypothetical protein [Deltaproteobacteria bacterium]
MAHSDHNGFGARRPPYPATAKPNHSPHPARDPRPHLAPHVAHTLQAKPALPAHAPRAVQRAAAASPHFTGATPANGATLVAAVVATAGGAKLHQVFEVEAAELGSTTVYRQYVRGWYKVNGKDFPDTTGSDKSGPPLDAAKWQEDGTKNNGAYGHRDDMDKKSYYYPHGRKGWANKLATGSCFYCWDEPGIEADLPTETELQFDLAFEGKLLSATGATVASRVWRVRGHARKGGAGWADV